MRTRAIVPGALGLALLPITAAAHAIHTEPNAVDWGPWILGWILLAVALYAAGVARMGRRRARRLAGCWRAASFTLGAGCLLVALVSPLDALADELFSAHMTQHLLVLLVAPPLLLFGRPYVVALWAFGPWQRRAIGRFVLRIRRQPAVRAALAPLTVWIALSFVLWFWHIPGPYAWALSDNTVHLAEHASFFFVSLAFWSLVIEPVKRPRRIGHGFALLYLGSIAMQNGLLGAILTFAARPLYSIHAVHTAAYGLTPLEDQQLAGVIMWVPASVIHFMALSVLFLAWMAESERAATGRVFRKAAPASA